MKHRSPEESEACSPPTTTSPLPRPDEDFAGPGGPSWYELLLRGEAWWASLQGNGWLNRLGRQLQALPVGKDLMLLINRESTWNRIATSRHGWLFAAAFYLVPMLIFSGVIEAVSLFYHGQAQITQRGIMERYSVERLVVFELVQAGGLLVLIFIAAVFMTSFGNVCHRRNRLREALLVMTHAVGPLVLLQAFNGLPAVSVWFTWILGVILVLVSLYHGVPRIMRPDPPSAMGLYVASSATVVLLGFGWRLLTYWYLTGDSKTWMA